MTLKRFTVIGALLLLALSPAVRAQSSARPSPIEVLTPKPPTPVSVAGKTTLVYELHITNFGPSALKLTGIQVFGSTGNGAGFKVAEYSSASLMPLLRAVADPAPEDASQLGIGHRVIAFMFLTVPQDARISTLRHRFSFDVADPTRGPGTPNDETALDGVMVPVLQRAPLILSPPFKSGTWLAGNGAANNTVHRRSVIAIDGHAYISQRFAIDWVKIGDNGNTFHDSRERNENFWAFGQPALAVADGEVTEVVDEFPDNVPDKIPTVTVRNILGNHVILRIAPDVYATYAHLKHGSIRVHLHEKLKRGAQLAEVGNSGNTTGSHLHFQLSDANSALASEGVPYVFERYRYLGLGKDYEPYRHPDEMRSHTLPADGTVLIFPSQTQ